MCFIVKKKIVECINKQYYYKKINSFVGLLYYRLIQYFQLDIKIIYMKYFSVRGIDFLLIWIVMLNFGDLKYYIGKFW